MKDIFSELYKKVLSFFNNEAKEENSKDTACNRLKLVLMQDRAKMEPALMEKMREEMIAVISKYVEIDKEALDLNLEAEGESFALMLNIPVLRAKTREEVEAAEGIVNDDDDDDDESLELEEDDENDESEATEEEAEEEDLSEIEESSAKDVQSEETKEDNNKIELVEDEADNKETVNDVSEEVPPKEDTVIKDESKPQSSNKKKIKHQKDDDL